MSKRDYYEVLGLKKGASDSDIKKAYRSLAKKLHPDAGGDEEAFKELSEAFEVLSDSDKKSNYDNIGHQSQQRRGSRSERRYHNFHPEQRAGDNITLLIKITLEESFTGTKKTYKYKRNDKCDICSGHGGTDIHECSSCGGRGFIIQQIQTPMGVFSNMFPCGNCNATGLIVKTPCDTCKGSGLKSIEETIDVNIPSGVQEGMTFIMTGKGNAIKGGGEVGDLHINILELPHDVYVRNGNDLKITLKLSYSQLVLGDKVDMQTIEGTKIRITIPEHSDVGSNLRIQNKGMKAYGKDNRGDVVITLGIDIPKTISSEAKEIIEKLKNL